ncbi:MAG: glycine zipper 2TM domain-containing protein [Prochlorococcaceae cyanobacterium]
MTRFPFTSRHSLALLAAGSLAAAPFLIEPASAYDQRYQLMPPPPVSSSTLYDYPPYTRRPTPLPYGQGYGQGYGISNAPGAQPVPLLTAEQMAMRCNTGRLVGGLLGGGAGYAVSRKDGRSWAVPLGALLGSQVGCSAAAGLGPKPW